MTDKMLLPPSAVDVEQQIIGACMLDPDANRLATRLMTPDLFYSTNHQKIFQAIKDLTKQETQVDTLTLKEVLTINKLLKKVGGVSYLLECTTACITTSNIKHYINIVTEKFKLRTLIYKCDKIKQDAYDYRDTADMILKNANIELINVMKIGHYAESFTFLQDAQTTAFKNLKKQKGAKVSLSSIPCGDSFLEAAYGGYMNGKLYFYAARPGNFKTTKLFLDSLRIAKKGYTVVFFSLEMSCQDLVHKAWANANRLDSKTFSTPKRVTKELLTKVSGNMEKFAGLDYYIDDEDGYNTDVLEIKIIEAIEKKKAQYILIDHLQLVKKTRGLQVRESVDNLSKMLKNNAKKYNIPIQAISQLNRSCEDIYNKKSMYQPRLSDFKESGAMEEDADGVAMAWTPQMYVENSMITEDSIKIKGSKLPFVNPANGHVLYKVSIKKNRYGARMSGYYYCDQQLQIMMPHTPGHDLPEGSPDQQDLLGDVNEK